MPILRCFRNRLDLSIIAQWRWNTMRGTWTSLGDPSAQGIKLWVSITIGYWRTKVAEWGKSNYGPRKQSWHKMYQFLRLRRKRFFGGLSKDIWLFLGKSRCKNDTAGTTASQFESLLHFMFSKETKWSRFYFLNLLASFFSKVHASYTLCWFIHNDFAQAVIILIIIWWLSFFTPKTRLSMKTERFLKIAWLWRSQRKRNVTVPLNCEPFLAKLTLLQNYEPLWSWAVLSLLHNRCVIFENCLIQPARVP